MQFESRFICIGQNSRPKGHPAPMERVPSQITRQKGERIKKYVRKKTVVTSDSGTTAVNTLGAVIPRTHGNPSIRLVGKSAVSMLHQCVLGEEKNKGAVGAAMREHTYHQDTKDLLYCSTGRKTCLH